MLTDRARLIAVTGGIGSGKTVVSNVLRAMGYPVYDCDSRAKAIMDTDLTIHSRLYNEIGFSTVSDGKIDRSALSAIVFADREKLMLLNEIVHGAVREDLTCWRAEQKGALLFVETAILYESALDKMVDCVWDVTAPTELRVRRVMARSGLKEEQILDRIMAQEATVVETPHHHIVHLVNDGITPILPQIENSIERLKSE